MNQAQQYHDYNRQSWIDGYENLEELKNKITWKKGEKILDIGCGPGDFTVDFLLPFVPDDAQIVGADISKEMLQYAKSAFDHPRVSFREIDIESEDICHSWQKESFSKIHSLYCFHWLDKYREAAENFLYLLKPGGEMFHVFLGEHLCFQKFNELITSYPWRIFLKVGGIASFGEDSVCEVLSLKEKGLYYQRITSGSVEDRKKAIIEEIKSVGLTDVKVEDKDHSFVYSSLEEFINVMKSVNPYRSLIPDDLLPAFDLIFNELCREMVTFLPEKGVYISEYTLFILSARKL